MGKQLADEGLVPRLGAATQWGSVRETEDEFDELMDMILLSAEVQELKANANASASGW